MSKTRMGSLAAIALLATSSFALAQGAGMGGSKGGDAPAAAAPRGEASSPSGGPAARGAANDAKPMNDSRSAPDPKAASDQKAAPAAQPATTAQDKPAAAPAGKAGTAAQERTDTKGTKSATDTKSTTDTKAATDTKTGDTKTGDTKSGSAATTGNAATSATVAPPTEKRTQITSAIRQEKVEEVRNVNFNISVGVAVPATVRVHPVPTRVIEIYPEWRGYDFILVNGRYVILRPQTREIVYVIEG